MTEDEAKTKWCPFARVSSYVSGNESEAAVNREDDGSQRQGTHCLADHCAVWREFEGDGYCGLSTTLGAP